MDGALTSRTSPRTGKDCPQLTVTKRAQEYLVSDQGLKTPGRDENEAKMLAMIAAILIVMWLLGLFAFHVTTGFLHIVLVVGIVLLVMHFFRGGRVTP